MYLITLSCVCTSCVQAHIAPTGLSVCLNLFLGRAVGLTMIASHFSGLQSHSAFLEFKKVYFIDITICVCTYAVSDDCTSINAIRTLPFDQNVQIYCNN